MLEASKVLDNAKRVIIDEFSKLSKIRGSNADSTRVITLLMIDGTLTQKQIHNRTGISRGKISTLMKNYIEQGLLSKEIIPGTHECEYKFTRNFPDLLTSQMSAIIQFILVEKQFIESIINKLITQGLQKLLATKYILYRLSQIWEFVEKLEKILKTLKFSLPKEIQRPILLLEQSTEYVLDAKLKPIEEEMINHFRNSNFMRKYNVPTAKTMAYFFLREKLVQTEVIALTGFSPASISLAFSKLEEQQLIIKEKAAKSGYIWRMPSILGAYQKLFLSGWIALKETQQNLTKVFQELDSIRNVMKDNSSYQNIMDFLQKLFSLDPIFEKFKSLI